MNGDDSFEVLDGQQRTISICEYVAGNFSINFDGNPLYFHNLATRQHNTDANELWLYFQNVINWVKVIFPTYYKEMKGIEWGLYYNKFKDNHFNSNILSQEASRLMQDRDVTNKKGIFEYLIDKQEKHLSIRAFEDTDKREVYEKQEGICPVCKQHFEITQMEADHITPWHAGGKTIPENCQMLCKECNRRKSGK